MTLFSHGHFTPSQLTALDTLLDSVTADQMVSHGDRERLATILIGLAQSGVASDAELRRRLLKAASAMMLDSGHFLEPRVRQVTLQAFMEFRRDKQADEGDLPSPKVAGSDGDGQVDQPEMGRGADE